MSEARVFKIKVRPNSHFQRMAFAPGTSSLRQAQGTRPRMHLRLISKAVRAYRAGRVGDAAAYKAAALTAPAYPEVERKLRQLAQPFPHIDMCSLRELKAGTFGHRYVQFMQTNALTPLVVSPAIEAELAATNALAVRYSILHDAFHVLLGFDTSLPGELGVWSFVAEQRYSPSFQHAATVARLLYPFLAPSKRGALTLQRVHGQLLAHQVPCLIAQPIEQFWQEPLAEVRSRIRIPAYNA